MIESGPAAGALAAAAYARRPKHVVSFDMGGTTAKVCLIDDAEPLMSPDFEAARAERFKPGSGIPLRTPVINLIEIGAGGGSIARMNELGLMKVGPMSAGADPGPACYGRGGSEPTVTDANTLLAYISPSSFLGGSMTLDVDAAAAAIDRLAEELGLDRIRTAWGIHEVVNESMAAAMRSHVAERNRDPRNYTLFAFGGAGPVHAVAVARKVGIPEVIVPLGAGVTSALGLLTAPMAVDLVQSAPSLLSEVNWDDVSASPGRARAPWPRPWSPSRTARLRSNRRSTCAMSGRHTKSVSVSGCRRAIRQSRARFGCPSNETYRSLYSVLNDSFGIEVLNWRVRVAGPSADLWFGSDDASDVVERVSRSVWEPASQSFVEAPVYFQAAMEVGPSFKGPLVVEQRETTAIVGTTDSAQIDASGNLVIQVGP